MTTYHTTCPLCVDHPRLNYNSTQPCPECHGTTRVIDHAAMLTHGAYRMPTSAEIAADEPGRVARIAALALAKKSRV
jgi:DnaJ-class molecular chaperone